MVNRQTSSDRDHITCWVNQLFTKMVFLSITVDDKSKYFEITQAGNTVTMKDGEVFGSVETQTQEFASEQDAKDFIDKTVAEKMSAGYTDDDTVFSMSSLKRPSNSTASAAKPSKIGIDFFLQKTEWSFICRCKCCHCSYAEEVSREVHRNFRRN